MCLSVRRTRGVDRDCWDQANDLLSLPLSDHTRDELLIEIHFCRECATPGNVRGKRGPLRASLSP
jgi:hypothetical protein